MSGGDRNAAGKAGKHWGPDSENPRGPSSFGLFPHPAPFFRMACLFRQKPPAYCQTGLSHRLPAHGLGFHGAAWVASNPSSTNPAGEPAFESGLTA
jgi:hypothetical protein